MIENVKARILEILKELGTENLMETPELIPESIIRLVLSKYKNKNYFDITREDIDNIYGFLEGIFDFNLVPKLIIEDLSKDKKGSILSPKNDHLFRIGVKYFKIIDKKMDIVLIDGLMYEFNKSIVLFNVSIYKKIHEPQNTIMDMFQKMGYSIFPRKTTSKEIIESIMPDFFYKKIENNIMKEVGNIEMFTENASIIYLNDFVTLGNLINEIINVNKIKKDKNLSDYKFFITVNGGHFVPPSIESVQYVKNKMSLILNFIIQEKIELGGNLSFLKNNFLGFSQRLTLWYTADGLKNLQASGYQILSHEENIVKLYMFLVLRIAELLDSKIEKIVDDEDFFLDEDILENITLSQFLNAKVLEEIFLPENKKFTIVPEDKLIGIDKAGKEVSFLENDKFIEI